MYLDEILDGSNVSEISYVSIKIRLTDLHESNKFSFFFKMIGSDKSFSIIFTIIAFVC